MANPIQKVIRRTTARYWSNDVLWGLRVHFPANARVINVSGWLDKDKDGRHYLDYFTDPKVYHVSNYADDSDRGGERGDVALDLMKELSPSLIGNYDIALNHTVLEHVPNPFFAFAQIARLTEDLVISVVPFYQHMHFSSGNYGDYFRFSPFAIRELHKLNGFETLFEAFTPAPSTTVYVLSVGSKKPHLHPSFPRQIFEDQQLNYHVGVVSSLHLIKCLGIRILNKISAGHQAH